MLKNIIIHQEILFFVPKCHNFTLLKYLFTILFFIIGISFTSFAQNKSTVISDPTAKFIKFYPNPASTSISFDFQKGFDKSYTLQIFNFMGKKVFEVKPTNLHNQISLNGFFRGVYIYQLRDRTGKILESNKFQVVR